MQHLIGRKIPSVFLTTNSGAAFVPAGEKSRVVYFCYPYTGRPGFSDPPDWDTIKGAHGSTPQALAYAERFQEFEELGVKIFGLSLLTEEWIADFAVRNQLPYQLLSDAEGLFSSALDLPRFSTGGRDYLQRLTMIVNDGVIEHVLFPIEQPAQNAAAVLNYLSRS